ncbi:MAG: DUF167 domain-containing protein [Proteobacteria bacterium]|nr:DUF167 domain-containing protein [Pseudomonadota bacterium]
MKISVEVKLKSRTEEVVQLESGSFLVKTNATPVDGKANQRIIELLSDFMNLPKSSFELVSGHRGKKKIFKISR